MVRSIAVVHRFRPAYSRDGLDVEGPDEDALTHAIALLEEVGIPPSIAPGTRIGRAHLVGPCPESDDWAVREALGLAQLEIHHHASGPAALFAALSLAASERNDGTVTVVVALDLASGSASRGSGAVGFVLREGEGARVTGHGQRAHPSRRRPNAAEWAESATRASGFAEPPDAGELLLISNESPPVLLAIWTKLHPNLPATTVPLPSTVGDSPTIGTAERLAELLARLPVGQAGIVARVESEQTYYLGVRSTGPVAMISAPPSEGRQSLPAPRRPPEAWVDRVSEGAYVPYPTYLENLPSRWRFLGESCGSCGKVTFPIRRSCRFCGEKAKLAPVQLPLRGVEVEAVTTVRPGAQPTEFDLQAEASGAYDVVLARLTPEVRVTLQGTDRSGGTIRVGDRVTTRLRRLYPMEGRWRYGRKAILLDGEGRPVPSKV